MSDNDETDGTVKFPEKKEKPLNTVFLPVLPLIDYQALMASAYAGIVKDAFKIMEADPEPGKYNFSITFDMGHPKVEVPDWVFEQYNALLTIVLNEQYDGLTVDEEFVTVTVYFRGQPAIMIIPFDAITVFRDEYMDFTIGFGEARMDIVGDPEIVEDGEPIAEALEEVDKHTEADIVSLDAFRKKDD